MRTAIRHGLTARDFHEVVKKTFVDIAREEYGIRGRPTNKSRIATLSGLTRVEVSRLIELGQKHAPPPLGTRHPLNRIVTRWLQTPWSDHDGQPMALATGVTSSGFAELVRDVGCDLPHQTLLRELVRLKIVDIEDEAAVLKQRAFLPGGADEADRMAFLGENAGALIDTIDHNLRSSNGDRRFERKVTFPGLDAAGMERLAAIAAREGQQLLERINTELTPNATGRDSPPDRMTGLGIYTFDFTPPKGEPFSCN